MKVFEYIGAKHTSRNPSGYSKDNVYHVIEKNKNRFKVQRSSEYSGRKSVSTKSLVELKRMIRSFDIITGRGEIYLSK